MTDTAAATHGSMTVGQVIDDMPRPGLTTTASVALSGGYFVALWEAAAVAPALPTIERGLDTTTAGLGPAIAVMFVGFALGAYSVGILSDRLGRQFGFRVTFSVLAVGALLTAVAPNVPLFAFGRFVVGCGMGAVMFLITMYVGEVSPKDRRGRLIALYTLTATVLIVVFSLLALRLIEALPDDAWRPMLGLPVVAVVIVFLVGRTHLVESPRWLSENGRLDEAVAVVRTLDDRARRGAGTLDPAVIEPGDPHAAEKVSRPVRTLFGSPKYRSRAVLLSALMIMFFTGFFGFSLYHVAYTEAAGLDEAGAQSVVAFSRISSILAGVLIVLLIERLERRTIILVCLALFMLGIAVTMVSGSFAAQLAGSLVVGLGAGMFAPSVYTFTAEIFPTEIRGTAAAFADGLGRLGGVIAPFTFVPILAVGGTAMAGTFTLVLMASAALIVFFGLRIATRNRPLDEVSA